LVVVVVYCQMASILLVHRRRLLEMQSPQTAFFKPGPTLLIGQVQHGWPAQVATNHLIGT